MGLDIWILYLAFPLGLILFAVIRFFRDQRD